MTTEEANQTTRRAEASTEKQSRAGNTRFLRSGTYYSGLGTFLLGSLLVVTASLHEVRAQGTPSDPPPERMREIEEGYFPQRMISAEELRLLREGKMVIRERKRWKLSTSKRPVGNRVLGVEQVVATTGAQQAWVANYPSSSISDTLDRQANAIAYDALGNVYETGFAGAYPNYDFHTVKYNSSGAFQWARTYNGPAGDDDKALAIAVDGSGNVHVAGISIRSGPNWGYATIKYNSSGVQQWVARYDPSPYTYDGVSLAIDGGGNVYVAGARWNNGWDFVTVKYNSSGAQQWVATYNGPGNGTDVVRAVAADAGGNVYVTGWSVGVGGKFDYATIKYNSAGVQQWVARYDGSANDDDMAHAIAVDGSGNVFVTGRTVTRYSGVFPIFDFATVKYNSSGVQQWARTYNGAGNSDDRAIALGIDGSGNTIVTGFTWSGINYDYATVKYNSEGTQQWVGVYNGTGDWDDAPLSMSIDGDGSAYVTGRSTNISGYWGIATVKYTASGTQLWVTRYDGPGSLQHQAYGLAVDGTGNVYAGGLTYNTMGSIYTAIKYTQSIYASVRAFLQGPFSTSTSLMNKTLNTSGLLASRYPGVTIPSEAVDSVNVEIRNAATASGSTIRIFKPAWLLTDGTIRDFNAPSKNYVQADVLLGNYYIVVRHRNHLAIMSAAAQPLRTAPPPSPYNFTTSQSQAYGTSPMKAVGSFFAMMSGDADGNGGVGASDLVSVRSAVGAIAYTVNDVDMNGGVGASDLVVVRSNVGQITQVP